MPFFGGAGGDYHIIVSNIQGGTNALAAVTGSNNMALGNGALQFAGATDFSIAIGNGALPNITAGQRNIAIGYLAASLPDSVNIGYYDNIVIGDNALTNGSWQGSGVYDNVIIGSNALNGFGNEVFGSVIIGKDANIGPALLNVDGAVVIGKLAAIQGTGGGSIAIGNNATSYSSSISVGLNTVANNNAISIGHNVTAAANSIIIGDATHTSVIIGGVTLSSATGSIFPSAIIGDAGTEGTGINIGGVTYDALLKVSDIASADIAQSIIHRHSTTWEPIQVFARSNSNGAGHGTVTNGMLISSQYSAGWTGTEYNLFGRASFQAAATGAISDTSSPGDYVIATTPNGGVLPVEAVRVKSDKSTVFAGGVVLPTSTWAALPAAATVTGQNYFVSDVGLRGGVFFSDGVNWIPNNESLVLGCGAIPVAIPSGGTVSANGALTLTTAFPTTYSGGIWLYFPAGAVYAGSLAGMYWTIMSSTTAGIIYNDRRDGTTTWLPSMHGTATPIVAAGPGAYTQTVTELTLSTNVLNGGLMGTLGALRGINTVSTSSSANTKVFNTKLAGTIINSASITTTVNLNQFILTRNRGAANIQINNQYLGIQANATAGGSVNYTGINTSVNCNYTITATTANNADFCVYESVIVELMR